MALESRLCSSVLLVHLVYCLPVVLAFLDIEELKSIKYGINLVNEPVTLDLKGDTAPENSIHVTSKYGQDYQCSFLNQNEADKKKEEEEKIALETGVPELLKPLKDGACLFKTRDWWSYEFCYEKHIKQFHLENGQISGDVMLLGYYQSEFDWNNETNEEMISRRSQRYNRYHAQQYVNGTKCDLTGKLRKTEVRFHCEEGATDYIGRLDEPEICSYILTIHTSKICSHPYLKPLEKSKPVSITCNPIISQEEYEEYLHEEEQEKKREKEKFEEEENFRKEQEELRRLQEGSQAEEVSEESSEETETSSTESTKDVKPVKSSNGENSRSFEFQDVSKINVGDMSKIQKLIQDELSDEMEKFADELGGQVEGKMKFKVIENMDDLQKILKTAREEANAMVMSQKKDEEEDEKDEGENKDDKEKDKPLKYKGKSFPKQMQDSMKTLDKELDEVDKMVTQEFDKDLGDEKIAQMREEWKKNRDNLKSIKDSIRETMVEEYDKIIEEAEEEMGIEVEDRLEAHKQLASTLNKLIARLEKTEKDITEVDKELEDISRKNLELQKQKSNRDTEKDEITKSTKSKDGKDVLQSESEEKDTEEKVKGPDKTPIAGSGEDGRIKVRVTKIKSSDVDQNSLKSSPQTEQLEKEVKDGLEKAGLDLGNGKIHVKIITAGYYDDKDDSVHVLSEEDTSAFRTMIVSILGGDQEASREEQKHQELEENYSLVWGKKKEKE